LLSFSRDDTKEKKGSQVDDGKKKSQLRADFDKPKRLATALLSEKHGFLRLHKGRYVKMRDTATQTSG
jgi:hypothetical protein